MTAGHGDGLDAEIARVQAEAEVRIAELRGKAKPGGPVRDDRPVDADTRSWDEFWAEVERKEAAERGTPATTVIRGIEVVIPHDLPLKFDQRLARIERGEIEDDEKAVEELVADLFGVDAYRKWVDAGMGGLEFRVVLLWGMANGKGQRMSFAEAYEAVKSQGKTLRPNRRMRRASAKAGGRSRRTSTANMGSPRRI